MALEIQYHKLVFIDEIHSICLCGDTAFSKHFKAVCDL